MIEKLIELAPIIILLVFLAIFCVTAFLVFRPKAKARFEKYAEIPLHDDDKKIAKPKMERRDKASSKNKRGKVSKK